MQLGFLELEVSATDAWHDLLVDVLGVADAGDGRYRHDGHAWRLQLREGPADDLACVGWELDSDAALDRVLHALHGADHEVCEADPAVRGCARRYLTLIPSISLSLR